MDQQVATFMLTMDALMDTRVGTCYRLNYALSQRLLTDRAYAERKSDYFAKDKRYQKLWKERDILTLCNSTGTRIFELINHLIQNEERDYAVGPGDFELTVYLNTYPYSLSDDEIDMYRSVLFTYLPQLGNDAHVKVVHVSDAELTPTFLAGNKIDCLVMYQWQDWLELHHEALVSAPQPLLHLIGPRIRKYEIEFTAGEDTEFAKKLIEEGGDFTGAEMGVQPILALRTMPVDFFNSIISLRSIEGGT